MIASIIRRTVAKATMPGRLSLIVRMAFSNDNKPIKGFERYRRIGKNSNSGIQPGSSSIKEKPQKETLESKSTSQMDPLSASNAQPEKESTSSTETGSTKPNEPVVENQHMRKMVFLVNELNQLENEIAELKARYERLKTSTLPKMVEAMTMPFVRDAGSSLTQLSNEVQHIRTVVKEVEEKIKLRVDLDQEEIRSVPKALKNLRAMMTKLRQDVTDRASVINPFFEELQRSETAKASMFRLRSERHKSRLGQLRKENKNEENEKEEEEEEKEGTEQKTGDSTREWLKKKLAALPASISEFFSSALKNYSNRFRLFYLVVLGLLFALYPTTKSYTEDELFTLIENGKVRDLRLVKIQESGAVHKRLEFQADGSHGKVYVLNSDQLLSNLHEKYPAIKIDPDGKTAVSLQLQGYTEILRIIGGFLGMAMLGVVLYKMGKSGNTGPFGDKATRQRFDMTKHTNVRFTNVAGLKESKFQIQEFVDFLKNPERYEQLGARIPKGALLTGPPGTGKTMLAKATAGEAGVPFFFVSGSDFVEVYVGVGASRVRDLFKEAKANSPAIVFIDEIDAIGKKRQNSMNSNSEKDGTLNQLLVEMDGFGTDNRVIVMAATNQKDSLDSALTRPGRFDRIIEVNLPDLEGRKEIFMVHLKPLKLSGVQSIEEYANRLATLTPGFSGAEIANLCNQAAITAARSNKQFVEPFDFEMATERVIGGVNRRSIMSKEEREVVAVHESGHAVSSWFLEGAYPLLKLTIIPRSKGALGFAQYLPSETRLETKEELIDRICFILGGRIAEEHFFKKITTGAADDLQKAYQIAHDLVTKYGMSEKVGYIGYRDNEYLKQYSKKMSVLIDQEVRAIINRCANITRQLIMKHEKLIRALADKLLEKETLDGKQIREILGQRPFAPHSSYRAYLEMEKGDRAPPKAPAI